LRQPLRQAADRRGELAGDAPVDADASIRTNSGGLLDVTEHCRQEMRLDPVAHELVARGQAEHPIDQAIELHAREPLVEGRGRTHARVLQRTLPRINRF
jgi:hypothetical protein